MSKSVEFSDVLTLVLDGDLYDCFNHLVDGARGALVQATFTLGVALPFFLYPCLQGDRAGSNGHRETMNEAPWMIVLGVYWGVNYLFGVAYYLQLLPWQLLDGVLLRVMRAFGLLYLLGALVLSTIYLLFVLSAISYSPVYVTNLLIFTASALAYALVLIRRLSQLAQIEHRHMRMLREEGTLDEQQLAARAEVVRAATATAVDLLRAQLRPLLEPLLADQGLKWEEAEAALLQLVNSAEELQEAVRDPQAVVWRLTVEAGKEARLTAEAHARGLTEEVTAPVRRLTEDTLWATNKAADQSLQLVGQGMEIVAKLKLGRRGLLFTLSVGGVALASAIGFIALGTTLWRSGGGEGVSSESLLAPLAVIATAIKTKKQIGKAAAPAEEAEPTATPPRGATSPGYQRVGMAGPGALNCRDTLGMAPRLPPPADDLLRA